MKTHFTRFFLAACFFLASLLCHAVSYYVATTGSNSSGGTLSYPFATIQHGLNIAQAGDKVFVRGGIYTEKLVWINSGTSTQKVLLANYLMETVVVNGGNLPSANLLLIQNKSNIEILGLIFEHNYMQDAKGIYVVGQGTSISIDKCIIRNIGWTTNPNADPFAPNPDGQAHGIIVNGRTNVGISNIRIEGCKIHDIISGNSEAVTLVGNVSNFTLLKDTVHDTKNIGIVVAGHYAWAVDSGVDPSLNLSRNGTISQCVTYNNRRFSNLYAPAGIYSDGASDVSIFGNKSYQNGNGMSVGCENAGFVSRNVRVYNNVVYDNDNMGVYFGSNAAGSLIKQCTLKNNTIFYNGNLGMFYSDVSLQNGDSCVIIQNILIPKSSSHYAVSIFGYNFAHLTVDNNLAYRYNMVSADLYVPGSPSQFTATNSLFENPQFVNSSLPLPDFNLLITSPAINKGFKNYDVLNLSDYNNAIRTVNGFLDHGAIEHPSGPCTSILTISNNLMLLKGKFIAQNKVIVDVQLASLFEPIDIFCPIVEFMSGAIVKDNMNIIPFGCN